jgi:outer membrane protein assembly factor BamE (lipoprotein component of BamABCDE complex)
LHPILSNWRAMPNLRFTCAAAALSAAMILAGCAATVEQRGNLPPRDELAEIHPGKTTKDQVVKILGSPSSVGVFDDKSWYYISRRTSRVAFFDPSVLDQEVYIVDFNNDGVVQAVDRKTLKDGRDITPVARTTPAPGRQLTFLEQIVGNLGRFNGGGGGAPSSGGSGNGPGPNPVDENH